MPFYFQPFSDLFLPCKVFLKEGFSFPLQEGYPFQFFFSSRYLDCVPPRSSTFFVIIPLLPFDKAPTAPPTRFQSPFLRCFPPGPRVAYLLWTVKNSPQSERISFLAGQRPGFPFLTFTVEITFEVCPLGVGVKFLPPRFQYLFGTRLFFQTGTCFRSVVAFSLYPSSPFFF